MLKPVIAITMGDPAGIGPEIVARTLISKKIHKICTPIIIGNELFLRTYIGKIFLSQIRIISCQSSRKIQFGKPQKQAGLISIESISKGVDLCVTDKADALVTAPVSKNACMMIDPTFRGHTEMLAKLTKAKMPIMMMQAENAKIIMLTRHEALKNVAKKLSIRFLYETIKATFQEFNQTYKMTIKKAVIAALNPHTGESGKIGKEEQNIIIPAIRMLRDKGYPLFGPIPSDTAWRELINGKYDLGFGMYHDQVMIPLKICYPWKTVNVTLGLPFVRTSPAHGVAYDIAGKNKANPQPMEEAICVAVDMVKRRRGAATEGSPERSRRKGQRGKVTETPEGT